MPPGADSFWVCFRLSLDPVTTVTDSGRDRMNTHARSGPILRRTRVSTLIPRPPVGLLRTCSTVTSAPGDVAFDGGIFHCGYFKLRHGPESTPLRGIWFFLVYLVFRPSWCPKACPEPAAADGVLGKLPIKPPSPFRGVTLPPGAPGSRRFPAITWDSSPTL